MDNKNRVLLSVMMFLNFFIWGSWFVTLGTFLTQNLNATGGEIGIAYSTQCWGAIIAPFIIGLIADRFFNAEKILTILHLAGAFLMYQLYLSDNFSGFYIYLLIYMILYMPTLALVNSISFNQMKDPAKEFSYIRVWGTIGWIIAGLCISWYGWDNQEGSLKNTFLNTSFACLMLALISIFLPKTPPKSIKGEKVSVSQMLGLDALKLLGDKNFLVFFLCSILICIPLAFYYSYTNVFLVEIGVKNSAAKMTIGQGSEVLFMLLLPIFFKRFGMKITILVGMLAWGLRYILFSMGSTGEVGFILLVGIALHGLCYDFFFVAGQIYTDSKAGEKYKSSAQGLITLATYGLGMLIGFWLAGKIVDNYKYVVIIDNKNIDKHYWETIWLYPAIFAFIIYIIFTLFFKNEKVKYE